jgi:hypothetical protein
MKRLLLLALLALALTGTSGARAACLWPPSGDGSLDKASHFHAARTVGPAKARAETLRKHAALAVCLTPETFFQYYASASIIMGKYGRRFCRWPLTGDGSDRREAYLQEAAAKGRRGLDSEFSRKIDILHSSLNTEAFGWLYAEISVLQAEYARGIR